MVEDLRSVLYQSAFTKFSFILVRFASAIPESLSLPMYVCEWVGVLLIVHDGSPLPRILLSGASVRADGPLDRARFLQTTGLELCSPVLSV